MLKGKQGLQLGKYLDLSFSCEGMCALPLVMVTLRSDHLECPIPRRRAAWSRDKADRVPALRLRFHQACLQSGCLREQKIPSQERVTRRCLIQAYLQKKKKKKKKVASRISRYGCKNLLLPHLFLPSCSSAGRDSDVSRKHNVKRDPSQRLSKKQKKNKTSGQEWINQASEQSWIRNQSRISRSEAAVH